jgi:hypothetical protein
VANTDQLDTDSDMLGDACDPDDDNDGVVDGSDGEPLNPYACIDTDGDGCDDCAVGTDHYGPLPDNLPANDGTDTDYDGVCDVGDVDDDNDGVVDGVDQDSTDPYVCADADGDNCDDCSIGMDGFGPLPDNRPEFDGDDADADGLCDLGDECTDTDGDGYGDPGYAANVCTTDNCPDIANADQADMDGDGTGDLCDPVCCGVRADINHSGTGPDISDLVYLVTYMFQSGPVPPCAGEADINGDGSGPDITDLVYLVTYMFQGGPAPLPCP